MNGIAAEAFVEGILLPKAEALRRDPGLGASGRSLIDALLAGEPDRVDDLLARDPTLANLTAGGLSLAEIAVATGDRGLVQLVVSRGAPPDRAGDGAALIRALHAREPDMALALLAAGASPTPPAARLEPFRAVISLGSSGGVRLLLDYGADPDIVGPLDRRPLHVALDMEQFLVAELLIDRGADPWALDGSGANLATAAETPMLTASPGEQAAQVRLRSRVRALGWPEPHPEPAELKARAALGDWPPARR